MSFYEITITGYKKFIVEADSQVDALNNFVTQDQMRDFIPRDSIPWDVDTGSADPIATPDLDQCARHGIKVFDKEGDEIA